MELDCVDSTNAEAKRLAEQGAPDCTIVWAKCQTSGRGRRGRKWVSDTGNLYFSILLRMPYPMETMTQLSFVAANAVADAVSVAAPRGAFVNVKWPNDVLVEGKKVSGILMEGEPDIKTGAFKYLVLGIGVNIANHPVVEEGAYPATSLAAQGSVGEGLSVEKMLDTLAKRFLAGVATWRNLGFGPIRRHWLARAKGVGGPVAVRLPNETIEGVFGALDENGALVLHLDGQPNRVITAGDVFISQNSPHI
ncbi:MAG: biotin--[acetyl-CoA-carboxylase] ligase [Magnetovibrio sp.]|nr:biotin--[acetyl-CoA-carboxylase] ligase [Magnetovibrio sp.]